MELANPTYPMRSVIRCKAKQQILTTENNTVVISLDENLLHELASTLFHSVYFQSLYRAYPSAQERCATEDQLALELAAIYQHVIQQRQQPLVQQLNALLLIEPPAQGE